MPRKAIPRRLSQEVAWIGAVAAFGPSTNTSICFGSMRVMSGENMASVVRVRPEFRNLLAPKRQWKGPYPVVSRHSLRAAVTLVQDNTSSMRNAPEHTESDILQSACIRDIFRKIPRFVGSIRSFIPSARCARLLVIIVSRIRALHICLSRWLDLEPQAMMVDPACIEIGLAISPNCGERLPSRYLDIKVALDSQCSRTSRSDRCSPAQRNHPD